MAAGVRPGSMAAGVRSDSMTAGVRDGSSPGSSREGSGGGGSHPAMRNRDTMRKSGPAPPPCRTRVGRGRIVSPRLVLDGRRKPGRPRIRDMVNSRVLGWQTPDRPGPASAPGAESSASILAIRRAEVKVAAAASGHSEWRVRNPSRGRRRRAFPGRRARSPQLDPGVAGSVRRARHRGPGAEKPRVVSWIPRARCRHATDAATAFCGLPLPPLPPRPWMPTAFCRHSVSGQKSQPAIPSFRGVVVGGIRDRLEAQRSRPLPARFWSSGGVRRRGRPPEPAIAVVAPFRALPNPRLDLRTSHCHACR
jgi:hypothetical protein